jgi:hypothetical protein
MKHVILRQAYERLYEANGQTRQAIHSVKLHYKKKARHFSKKAQRLQAKLSAMETLMYTYMRQCSQQQRRNTSPPSSATAMVEIV